MQLTGYQKPEECPALAARLMRIFEQKNTQGNHNEK